MKKLLRLSSWIQEFILACNMVCFEMVSVHGSKTGKGEKFSLLETAEKVVRLKHVRKQKNKKRLLHTALVPNEYFL